uniref:60S ribosomal protein L18a n=1 Tax=Henneguya salminicola TaxID=69463 RepID=A0A6G3MJC5_HENSL
MSDQCGVLKEFKVIGRMLPTEKLTRPPIYKMSIFAKNEVAAKSKFWYFLRKLKRIKKTKGEVLDLKEVYAKKPKTVKNVGIWLRMDTRTKTLNMYREYRDTSINGAVNRCYSDVAGKHRARSSNVQIIQASIVPASQCKKKNITQFHDSHIKFPIFHRVTKNRKRNLFARNRPSTAV